jgi:hypothetical protein
VNFGETLADVGERSKVRRERNARQFAFQVRRVTLVIERFDLRFRLCWSIAAGSLVGSWCPNWRSKKIAATQSE